MEAEGTKASVRHAIANLVAYLQAIQKVQQHASVKQRGLDRPVRESDELRDGSNEATVLGFVDVRFDKSAEILRRFHAGQTASKDYLRDTHGNVYFGL